MDHVIFLCVPGKIPYRTECKTSEMLFAFSVCQQINMGELADINIELFGVLFQPADDRGVIPRNEEDVEVSFLVH